MRKNKINLIAKIKEVENKHSRDSLQPSQKFTVLEGKINKLDKFLAFCDHNKVRGDIYNSYKESKKEHKCRCC